MWAIGHTALHPTHLPHPPAILQHWVVVAHCEVLQSLKWETDTTHHHSLHPFTPPQPTPLHTTTAHSPSHHHSPHPFTPPQPTPQLLSTFLSCASERTTVLLSKKWAESCSSPNTPPSRAITLHVQEGVVATCHHTRPLPPYLGSRQMGGCRLMTPFLRSSASRSPPAKDHQWNTS